MSLKITSTLETPQGEELINAYGRVAVVNSIYGSRLESVVAIYKDLASYEAGKVAFEFPGLVTGVATPYEYSQATANILDLGHDALVELLAGQGVTAVKELS